MMQVYLLVFDEGQITRKEMLKIVDQMPDVANWHAFFGNSICLASVLGAKALAYQLNRHVPDLRYLITRVEPEHKGGRAPRTIMEFLNTPHSALPEPA